jgi:hypothetical protein
MYFSLIPLIISFSFLSPPTNAQQAIITITDTPAYNSAASCVRNCVWDVGAYHDVIVALGCTAPWYNDCLCRTDGTAIASSFLSSCVNEECTAPTQDPNSAISLYSGYCANANAVSVATTTVATGTGGVPTTAVGSTNTLSVPVVTATTGSAGAKTSSGGTSNGVGRSREWVFGAFGLTLVFMM